MSPPVAIHEVENPRWKAGGVNHLAEQQGRQGRLFARLKDDGTPHKKSRDHLERDLAHWPVPRSYEGGDANGLVDDRRVASDVVSFLELAVLACLAEELLHRKRPRPDLY